MFSCAKLSKIVDISKYFSFFYQKLLLFQKIVVPLHPLWSRNLLRCHAQMAESVDALVSNTSGATRAGSTPALGTKVPRVRLKRRTGSTKARCCKTTTYSTFSFYRAKVFLSIFSPHFPHRRKFNAIEWEILGYSSSSFCLTKISSTQPPLGISNTSKPSSSFFSGYDDDRDVR